VSVTVPLPETPDHQTRARTEGLSVAVALAVGVAAFLVSFAWRYGYMSDELYFLACAEHPAWGYVDLPPLLPWITWIVRHTLGTSLVAIRLYPALAIGATVLLTARVASELGGRRRAVIIAAVLVAVAPVMLAIGHILSTNALDMPLWVASVLLLVRIEKTANARLWVPFGIVVGFALLNKYTLAFYLAALVAGTLITPWRRWFLNRWLWAGVAIATLIVLPNALWQAHRDFPFLQLQHNINAQHRNVILPPLQFLFAQSLLVNLLSFAFVVAGAVFFFTPPMKRFRALGWTFIAYMLLMFALHAKDYLVTPVYPAMFAAGAVAAEGWFSGAWSRRLVAGYVVAACALCCLMLPTFVPVLTIEDFERYYQKMPLHRTEAEHNSHTSLPDFYSDNFGWRESAQLVARYYNALPPEERRNTAILGNFYGEAGAIDLFGPALGLPKAIGGHHSYWYWGSRGYTGESVIFLDARLENLERHCASVSVVAERSIPWTRPDRQRPIYHCRKLDYDLSREWGSYRHFD
jgi:Dolichyl-phosphate-mannose-protein mannosyltransferase